MALHEKRCIPCEGGVPPLDDSGREPLLSELNNGWQVVDGHHLERTWSFPDFAEAHGYLATALQMQGNLDDAIRHYQEALRIAPGTPEMERRLQAALAER